MYTEWRGTWPPRVRKGRATSAPNREGVHATKRMSPCHRSREEPHSAKRRRREFEDDRHRRHHRPPNFTRSKCPTKLNRKPLPPPISLSPHRRDRPTDHDEEQPHLEWYKGMRLRPYLEVLGILGEGTFGRVLECYDWRRECKVAVKVVRAGKKYTEAAMIEAETLELIGKSDPEKDSGCVQCFEWFMYKDKWCSIVTERLGMSLYDFLSENHFKPFTLVDIRTIARDVVKALSFLKAIKLTHTDLKLENILLVDDEAEVNYYATAFGGQGSRSPRFLRPLNAHVKIVDFGGATFADDERSSLVNTRQYRAPEVILNLDWDEASDIWCVGCVLVELWTGELLFQTHEHLEHLAMMEKRLEQRVPPSMIEQARAGAARHYISASGRIAWPNCQTSDASLVKVRSLERLRDYLDDAPFRFQDFVECMLRIDPKERASPEALLRHPFLCEPV